MGGTGWNNFLPFQPIQPLLPFLSGTRYGSVVRNMPLVMAFSALAVLGLAAACKEGGTITVHSLSFKGVQAINEGRLRDALATHQSSHSTTV